MILLKGESKINQVTPLQLLDWTHTQLHWQQVMMTKTTTKLIDRRNNPFLPWVKKSQPQTQRNRSHIWATCTSIHPHIRPSPRENWLDLCFNNQHVIRFSHLKQCFTTVVPFVTISLPTVHTSVSTLSQRPSMPERDESNNLQTQARWKLDSINERLTTHTRRKNLLLCSTTVRQYTNKFLPPL